ncbi:MAG: type II secretion system protein [Burkholderiaceae bacterium]|nr:type II secretion system protein [Burkholderiaceae bacterium]
MRTVPERALQSAGPAAARGLVLLALLIMLILVGVGALGAAEVWSTTLKREREAQLLFVGEQYRRAIGDYWRMSPGRRAYPPSIDVLLTDDRFPNPVHHLRRVYRDPMTEAGDFEPILQANAMIGVHSTSTDAPMKKTNFPPRLAQFENAESYAAWQFIFVPVGVNFNPAGLNQPANPNAPSPFNQGPAPGVAVPQAPTGR